MSIFDDFRKAMGQFAGAVTAITTTDGDQPVGLIATAVCSLSAEPPSILVCVNRSASAHDVIIRNGTFAVNLLHPSQCEVVESFTKLKGPERFNSSSWCYESGVPMLDKACVSMRCELKEAMDGFSHSIMVGVIKEIRFREVDDEGCLLWRGKGLHCAVPMAELAR
ncbi:flavin reductase [Pseudomonas sp. WPR_5_2]|uniref:flavin reductase family protein n=1 Tax=Pseudomonas sp. WPR_5_2 TaxID=1907371 RepID=UPI000EADF4F6|nr:flavin reductase family protein [Pseudomonas sp. WPR_5_2]RKS18953.1 flavin reductase [Pseudomonas sp. WPR_5_2]